jgi:hypothetical protein
MEPVATCERSSAMKQYLISIYQPDGPIPPPEVLEPIMREVYAIQKDLKDKGQWVFSGGLHPPSTATVVRLRGSEMVTSDGPFAEGKEHLGGFTIIKAADLDEALAWGQRTARAVAPLAVEIRPFQDGHP